jgi:aquaporin NIP
MIKNRYVAEAIGTFSLVFCGTGAIVINEFTGGTVTHVGIAMTFGLIVKGMIFAFGEISGAVTIGFAFAKKFRGKMFLPNVFHKFLVR